MKGKKIDINFITNFVAQCVQQNKSTPEQICSEAKDQIKLIDEKIKEINSLKLQRSKLQDVLISFEKNKKDTSKDKLKLEFYNIEYKAVASQILHYLTLNVETINISTLSAMIVRDIQTLKEAVIFTIKQLVELKVLQINNKEVSQGINFNTFKEFIDNYMRPHV